MNIFWLTVKRYVEVITFCRQHLPSKGNKWKFTKGKMKLWSFPDHSFKSLSSFSIYYFLLCHNWHRFLLDSTLNGPSIYQRIPPFIIWPLSAGYRPRSWPIYIIYMYLFTGLGVPHATVYMLHDVMVMIQPMILIKQHLSTIKM